MLEFWDSVFCERVGVCAGLFFCERGARERNAFERDAFERDAREACAACRRGFVGGWLLGCRNSAKTASKILKLASEAAQTVRIFEATQISASQESAPLLQSPSTGSTRLTGWFFRAVGSGWLLGSFV